MLPTPYVDLDRRAWSRLRESHPMSLEQSDLARLRGLGERLDLNEVEEVYLPLSRLLHFYVEATHGLRLATSEFLGERPTRVPFVVGVAGSVAVGKSTTSRILKELMSRWPHTPRVELITTDGFLHSNAELERRGDTAGHRLHGAVEQRLGLRGALEQRGQLSRGDRLGVRSDLVVRHGPLGSVRGRRAPILRGPNARNKG